MADIKMKWEAKQELAKKMSKKRLLFHILGESDQDEDEEGEKDGCLICHV